MNRSDPPFKLKPQLKAFHRTAKGLGVLGGGVVFCFLSVAYVLSGEIYDYQDTVQNTVQGIAQGLTEKRYQPLADGASLPAVDAIVCLAGGRGRIAAAGDVWYRYWRLAHENSAQVPRIPVLYFSGMGRQATWPLLSKQLRRGVMQVIRPEEVIIENESSNTDTNAQWLARYARERSWRKILLLTSSYHMKRAHYIFDRVLKFQENSVEVETLSVYQEPFASGEWRLDLNGVRVTLLEYLKWIYYRSIW